MRSDLERGHATLDSLRAHPALRLPATAVVGPRRDWLNRMMRDVTRALAARLRHEVTSVEHARAQVTALSPAATLSRGYAVVQRSDGTVVRSADDAPPQERLRVRLAQGEIAAVVTDPLP
jgi:exodeoxyribonuclease VII large subunit